MVMGDGLALVRFGEQRARGEEQGAKSKERVSSLEQHHGTFGGGGGGGSLPCVTRSARKGQGAISKPRAASGIMEPSSYTWRFVANWPLIRVTRRRTRAGVPMPIANFLPVYTVVPEQPRST